jgi:tetratricopeptide (TPR) repeat protein
MGVILRAMKSLRGIVSLALLCAACAAGRVSAATAGSRPGGERDLCKQNFNEYRDRLRKSPDDGQAWSELRVCADLLQRWGEAGAIAGSLLEHGVNRYEPHLILGQAYYHAKDYTHAADEFKEAVRLKDDLAMGYFQLGLTYLHLNQPADAVAAGVRATELDPNNSAYHHQLAFSYLSTHDDENCEIEAKKAIEIDKNDIAAYKILGNLYGRQGKQAQADQMMEESIHANGRIAAAHPFVPDKRVTVEEMSPNPFQPDSLPTDTEVFLKAQWERMKQAARRGDIDAAAAYYSTVGNTQEAYRASFNRMGPARMKDVFGKLGEIADCEVAGNGATATCRCSVNGGSGTMLETRVRFENNPDHIWRIKSF